MGMLAEHNAKEEESEIAEYKQGGVNIGQVKWKINGAQGGVGIGSG